MEKEDESRKKKKEKKTKNERTPPPPPRKRGRGRGRENLCYQLEWSLFAFDSVHARCFIPARTFCAPNTFITLYSFANEGFFLSRVNTFTNAAGTSLVCRATEFHTAVYRNAAAVVFSRP